MMYRHDSTYQISNSPNLVDFKPVGRRYSVEEPCSGEHAESRLLTPNPPREAHQIAQKQIGNTKVPLEVGGYLDWPHTTG